MNIIVSERFAINVLANHLKIAANEIEYVSGKDPAAPVDLQYDGKSYDVKFSNPTTVNAGGNKIWDFDIRGKKDYCDFFLLVGMVNQRPQAVFLIPSFGTPNHHIRMAFVGFSKYHKHLIWNDTKTVFAPTNKPLLNKRIRKRKIIKIEESICPSCHRPYDSDKL